MIDHAVLSHQTDALDETCTVSITPANVADEGLSQYGLGAQDEAATTTDLACLYVPSRRAYDRELGMMVTRPERLIIDDPNEVVSNAVTVTFRGETHRIAYRMPEQPGSSLVLVTLGAA